MDVRLLVAVGGVVCCCVLDVNCGGWCLSLLRVVIVVFFVPVGVCLVLLLVLFLLASGLVMF